MAATIIVVIKDPEIEKPAGAKILISIKKIATNAVAADNWPIISF